MVGGEWAVHRGLRVAEEGGWLAGLARGGGEEAEGRMRGLGVSGGLRPRHSSPLLTICLFPFFCVSKATLAKSYTQFRYRSV